jgi:hypothetical protein
MGGLYTLKDSYNGTVNAMATNAVGVLMETPYASGTSASFMSTALSTTNSIVAGKVIINPGAVYLVEQKISTSDAIAVTRVSSTTVESVVAGTMGHYVYFPNLNANAASGVKGSLRRLYSVSVTSGAMAATLTGTATASDYMVMIYPKGSRAPALTTDSTKVTCGTAAVTGGTTNLIILETYIDRDQGLEILHPFTHGALDNLHYVKGGQSGTNYSAGPHFYYDVAMKSHLYGNSI